MKKLKPKLIIFDFDGTIADTKLIYYNIICNFLKAAGYKDAKEKAKKLISLKTKLKKSLRKVGIRKKDAKKLAREINDFVLSQADKVKKCSQVDKIKDLRKKYILLLISNSRTDIVKKTAKQLKIKKYFSKIIGGDKFTRKEQEFEKLFRKYKIKPHEAVYIGDRTSDVKITKKVGCISVVPAGKCAWSSRKQLVKVEPDFIIYNLSDLLKILA